VAGQALYELEERRLRAFVERHGETKGGACADRSVEREDVFPIVAGRLQVEIEEPQRALADTKVD
jgi:hypothetical protein